ncbi:MAG: VCBS domain-containing protein [Pseudomonadota bacterium]
MMPVKPTLSLATAALAAALASSATAHDVSYPLMRDVKISSDDTGTQLTLRLPATLFYADAAAQRTADQPAQAPGLIAVAHDGGWTYQVDHSANAVLLGQLVDQTLQASVGDGSMQLVGVRFEGEHAHISSMAIVAHFEADGHGDVQLVFPSEHVPLPSHTHRETVITDQRTAQTLRRIGRIDEPLRVSE